MYTHMILSQSKLFKMAQSTLFLEMGVFLHTKLNPVKLCVLRLMKEEER